MTHIAVVNDDTVFLDMMATVLQEKGWDTSIYRETDGALSRLKHDRPDLVILDIRMENPEAGWTLLELMTLDPEMAPIPVIVCSAAIQDLQAHEEWLRQRGISVLPKPFNIADLYTAVESALAPRR